MEGFLLDAEKVDIEYKTYITGLSEEELVMPKFDTWGCRYTILSSFLYLEAFINSEFFSHVFPSKSPRDLSPVQIATLDQRMVETRFEDKWSIWIEQIIGDKLNLKGDREHQELMQLARWRNHLTHYKIQLMMLIHSEIETIENAREAKRIAIQSTKWYYDLIKSEPPEWIQCDILGSVSYKTRLGKDVG